MADKRQSSAATIPIAFIHASVLTAIILCFLAWLPGAAAAAPPINDDFADAIPASGDLVEGKGNTFGATKEAGEPDHDGDPGGASVWFTWTAPRSQNAFIEICTDGWGARLAVYTGDSVSTLYPVASAHVSEPIGSCALATFPSVSTTEYRIAIDGSTASGALEDGNFEFSIDSRHFELPANDSFANAESLKSSDLEWIYGTTDGATREIAEPGDGSDLAGASVWYRWTAPNSGPTRLYPCKGNFRADLSVYVGSTLEGLKAIGTQTPLEPPLHEKCQLGRASGLEFNASAGETYTFEVDGLAGAWGSFWLRFTPPAPVLPDTSPPNTRISRLVRLAGRGVSAQFASSDHDPGVTYVCRLDRGPFAPCPPTRRWHRLAAGVHWIVVASIDAAGNRDRTPARRTFKIRAAGSR